MLKVGDRAPDFTARTSSGELLQLSSLRGKKVVVYFYPKAFTPGCSAETRRFRDNYPELKELGVEVVGISTDKLDTQCNFARENQVSFPLVSDEEQTISKAWDVLWPIIGVDKRVTFVLDEEQVVRAVFRHELQVLRHLDDVVRFLKR